MRYPGPRIGVVLPTVISLLGCGEEQGELREWRASDHQEISAEGDLRAAPAAEGTSEERAAAALWTVSCASCHGRAGAGDGPARTVEMPVRNLTDPEWQASVEDEEIAQVIAQGRNMMPRFDNQINERGITALVRHIRGLRAE
ncbi:MAG: cytochrome c [Myxococcota bacterium]